VYDALATDRPYRKAFSHEKTMSIMQSDTGHIFDPTLFSVFREVVGGGLVRATASSV
jgi:putative two-component system response regulator